MKRGSRSRYTRPDFQFARFRLSGRDFGLDIECIREIIRFVEPLRPEGTPGFLEGFIRLRSMLIPVLDLRKRFFLPAGHGEKVKIIISSIDSLIIGLIADQVDDISPGTQETVLRPGGEGRPWDPLVEASIETPTGKVLILGASMLLSEDEKKSLCGPPPAATVRE